MGENPAGLAARLLSRGHPHPAGPRAHVPTCPRAPEPGKRKQNFRADSGQTDLGLNPSSAVSSLFDLGQVFRAWASS